MGATRTVSCVFCEIVAGRQSGEIVLREDGVTAFLDRRPVFKGHVLIVPDEHVETLPDLDAARVAPLFAIARRVTRSLPRALAADGTWVAINNTISQSVPHLHVHVVPRRKGDGLRGFFWPRVAYASDEERAGIAERIRAALQQDAAIP